MEQEKKERKQKEYEDWANKLKGTKYFYSHNINQDQHSQLDKHKVNKNNINTLYIKKFTNLLIVYL